MEVHNQWIVAQRHLRESATSFLDACLALKKVAAQSLPSHPNQIMLENVIHDVQSKIGSIAEVESHMYESRAALNALLNHSSLRVPINKLPTEILGRIFAIAVGDSPCPLTNRGRDNLLDVPRVCSRWYQVATNNRSLWSHIDIRSCPKGTGPNLARLWLERSHGVPIHIHVNRDSFQASTAISNLVCILQPYEATTNSLLISGMNPSIARALFALYLGKSGPGILSTLAVSSVWDQGIALPWPTYPIPGLTSLELCNLQDGACPTLDELATILSDCPRLHTLRLAQLRDFRIHSDQQQNHPVISLPRLRLLEIAVSGDNGLATLLALIHPGGMELHVRLGIESLGGGLISRAAQLLLARSNVVSLALSNIESRNLDHVHSLFSCLPGLRALRIDRFDHVADTLLRALVNYDTLHPLPNLRLLCLSEGEVHSHFMARIKLIVGARQLRSLLFWSCMFPSSFQDPDSDAEREAERMAEAGNVDMDAVADEDESVQTQNSDQNQDQDDDDDGIGVMGFESGTPDMCFPFMPMTTKEWLLEHVERLVVCETPSAHIINGVDVLAQEMIKVDSKDCI